MSRKRSATAGWRREHAVDYSPGLAMVTDGRAIDATRAVVAYYDLSDGMPRLAIRDGGCWRPTVLSGARSTFIGMDLDSMNRPWAAWLGPTTAGLPGVTVAGPDGAHLAWTSPIPDGLYLNDRPAVLAGGWAGTGAYPALAFQRTDGVHVLAADDRPLWTDRLLPGSAQAAHISDCPPQQTTPGLGGLACNGRTSCQGTTKGALNGLGMARTSAGRAYAVWLTSDGATTYTLGAPASPVGLCPATAPVSGGTGMPMVAPTCFCLQTPGETHGTATIVITRVDTPAVTDVLRVTLDVGGELRAGALVLATRGNTLLVVASIGIGPNATLRYLEIDTTQLP